MIVRELLAHGVVLDRAWAAVGVLRSAGADHQEVTDSCLVRSVDGFDRSPEVHKNRLVCARTRPRPRGEDDTVAAGKRISDTSLEVTEDDFGSGVIERRVGTPY